MNIKSPKQKGSNWEREAARILESIILNSTWKRIPSSGAIGTIITEPILTGDLKGTVELYPKPFKGEAKIGYGGAKQFTLKKEWLDKIAEEAGNNYAIPFLIGRFSGARSGIEEFVILDLDTFSTLINLYTELQRSIIQHEESAKSLEISSKTI